MKTIPVITEKKGETISVRAPMVGIYGRMPVINSLVTEHSDLGRITSLRSEFQLVFPSPVKGKIIRLTHRDKMVRVEYGQELFQVETKIKSSSPSKKKPPASGTPQPAEGDGHTVRAFTTGIFYLKPSPDSPPFITKDQVIQKGKILGLIEVMKTFNQIVFQGIPGINVSDWIVREIFRGNGEEVKLGDPLFLLEETAK